MPNYIDINNIPQITGSLVPFVYGLDDSAFVSEASQVAKFVAIKLGINIVSVELEPADVFTSYQESYMEFGALANIYQAKSIINSVVSMPLIDGTVTFEDKLPYFTMDLIKKQAQAFNKEANVGGDVNLNYSWIDLQYGVQRYNINEFIPDLPSGSSVEVREVFHFSPVSAYRFFDTSSMLNYLNNQFKFESFTPETIFFLLPVWEDILRAQQLQMAAKVRRSHYSYIMHGDYINIYPVPQSSQRVWFSYYFKPTSILNQNLIDPVVTGLANIPFNFIAYSTLNENSKQWIRRFTLELSRELLGRVRGKVESIPIPGSELRLDAERLISDAIGNQDKMREELKLFFEEMTYDKIAEREAIKAENNKKTMEGIPMFPTLG